MKNDFESLLNRSYAAIEKRGLITHNTTESDFFLKMKEELSEVADAFNEGKQRYVEECTDLATVCFMQIKHLGYDPIKEFEKVVIKNENRND